MIGNSCGAPEADWTNDILPFPCRVIEWLRMKRMISSVDSGRDTLVVSPPQRQTSGRIAVIDGLRGIAILSVLFYHVRLCAIAQGGSAWEHLYQKVTAVGWAGVDLFFVLSGYLITNILLKSVGNKDYYRVFYFRRTVRIFPLYYASLALFFGVVPLVLTLLNRGHEIGGLVKPSSQPFAWLYILNWRVGLFSFDSVPSYIHHFWTLSIEEQFYLVWPFIVRTVKPPRLMVVCLTLIGGSFLLRVIFQSLQMQDASYALTPCRLDSLAIGGIIALASRNSHYWGIVKKAALPLTMVTFGALIVLIGVQKNVSFLDFWMGTVGISLWGLFFGGVLVLALDVKEGSMLHRVASARLLQFFGKYSYGLYVFHQPLILALAGVGLNSDNLVRILGSKALAVVAVNSIVVFLMILVALASWHLLEKHFLKLKDRFPMGQAAR